MGKIKHLFTILLLFIMLLPGYKASAMSSDTLVDIRVNGEYINCDVRPFLEGGTTYVPIRFVSEALGADEVSWDGETGTAVIRDEGKVIELPVGENYGYVDGKQIKINSGVKLVGDRTFVPVRFVSENLGATVDWDYDYYIVIIDRGDTQVPSSLIKDRGYSDEDLYWMSRIIEAEAAGEPIEGKVAVGDVVLNRVASKDFPDTVQEVVFDTNYGIQFQPVANGTIMNKPSHDSVVAAKYALEGTEMVGDSMFFLNPDISTSFWIVENRQYYTTIGNHDFYM